MLGNLVGHPGVGAVVQQHQSAIALTLPARSSKPESSRERQGATHAKRRSDPMSLREQWQVAGNAAEIYEKELVPAIFAPWASLLVDLARPQEGDRALDVACGTGIVARTVGSRVG